jgi:hypothetical protein
VAIKYYPGHDDSWPLDRIVLSKVTAREISFGKSLVWGYAHTIITDNGWGAPDALN